MKLIYRLFGDATNLYEWDGILSELRKRFETTNYILEYNQNLFEADIKESYDPKARILGTINSSHLFTDDEDLYQIVKEFDQDFIYYEDPWVEDF